MFHFAQHPSVLPTTAVLTALEVTVGQGLSTQEASARQKQYGRNQLPPPRRPNLLALYLHQFLSPLIYLLVGAAATAWLLNEQKDAIVILAVVLVNSLIGFYQEWRAQHKMAALKKYLAPMAKVIRDGHLEHIPADQITLGDIMVLEAGDRVPADGRILQAHRFSCNEASFTGEATPAQKTAQALTETTQLGDQKNMVLMASLVTAGSAQAVVTAIGTDTALGHISTLLTTAAPQPSPLKNAITKLSRQLLLLTLAMAVVVVLLSLRANLSVYQSIEVALSLAVSAIPEGLPVVLTVTLSLGLWRLAKQNSIIRQLDAVETLGSVDVICTDKTGTLTRGEMMVNALVLPNKQLVVTGQGFEPTGQLLYRNSPIAATKYSEVQAAIEAALLSTSSRVTLTNQSVYQPIGDPTEVALYVLAKKLGFSRKKMLEEYELLLDVPFDQTTRLSARVYKIGNKYLSIVKGSPESVGTLLSAAKHKWVKLAAEQLAKKGNRLIALGWRISSSDPRPAFAKTPRHWPNLYQVVALSLSDGLRADSAAAVAECRRAGIKVIMVTGDHLLTATHIGQQVGLADGEALLGEEASALRDSELQAKLEVTSIFARASSDLKMRLVTLLQKTNQIVAMTGDGVNDAPALKQADVGVAMGRTGSDVAVSVADVVLTQDTFSSFVAAIKEGRTIWLNLRKVIFYLLSTSLAEVTMIVAALAVGLPLPLLPAQILWINLVTDGFLDMGLATESAEDDVMSEPPRGRTTPLLDAPLLRRLVVMGLAMGLLSLSFFALDISFGETKARTMALVNLAALQWFNVWNARSETKAVWQMSLLSNKTLLLSLLICVCLQLLAVYWSPMHSFLGTVALQPMELLTAVAAASSIMLLDAVWKMVSRRKLL